MTDWMVLFIPLGGVYFSKLINPNVINQPKVLEHSKALTSPLCGTKRQIK